MQIIIQCPYCAYRWRLTADAADRRLRCGKCSALLKVPHLAEVPDAVRAITRAVGEVYVDDAGRTYG